MDHHYYIDYACKLAVANVNNGKGGPFGAVIVKDGDSSAKERTW